MCKRCPTEQVADTTRTKCVCPRDTYNSSTFGGNAVQCLADYHLADLADIPAATECMPCSGFFAIKTDHQVMGIEFTDTE